MRTSTPYELRLFGGPRLRAGKRTIRLSPQSQLLLGLIAGSGPEGIQRSRLLDLMWDGGDANTLRPRLAQALYALRRHFGEDQALLEADQSIVLNPRVVSSDLETFEDALQRDDFATAVTLFERGFLSRCEGGGAEELQAWVEERREGLREALSARTAVAFAHSSHSAAFDLGVAAAQARKRIELTCSATEEGLVLALLLAGRLDEAASCLQTLGRAAPGDEDDTALAPPSRVIAMATKALIARSAGVGSVPELTHSEPVLNWEMVGLVQNVLTGRAPQLEPAPHGLLLISAPRTGVRHFLAQVLRMLQAQGAILFDVDAYVYSHPDEGANSLIAKVSGEMASGDHGSESPVVLYSQTLTPRSAHSTALLAEMARATQDSPRVRWLFLETDTAGDPSVVGPKGPGHPGLSVIRVPAPSHNEMIRGAARLRPDLPNSALETISSLSGGDWEFLKLITLQWGDPLELSHAFAAVEDLFAELPRDQKEILLICALADCSWELLHLAEVCGRPLSSLTFPLRNLEARGLLDWDGGRMRLRAKLIAIWVANHRSVEAIAVAVDLAPRLDRLSVPASVKLQAWALAGESRQVIRWARKASAAGRASGQAEAQITAWRIALDSPLQPESRREATQELGRALCRARRWTSAKPLLAGGAAEALSSGDLPTWIELRVELAGAEAHSPAPDLFGTVNELERLLTASRDASLFETSAKCIDLLLHLQHRIGAEDRIRSLIEEAEQLVTRVECARARVRLHATLAMKSYFGDPSRGGDHALNAVSAAREIEDGSLLLFALNRQTAVWLAEGRLDTEEGRILKQEVLTLAGQSTDFLQRLHPLINLAVWEADSGRPENAILQLDTLIGQVKRTEDRRLDVILHTNAGLARVKAGDLASAKHNFEIAQAHFREWTSAEVGVQVAAGLGLIALEEGRFAHAQEIASELDARPQTPATDLTVPAMFRATLLRRKGKRAQALQCLTEAIEASRDRFPLHFIALVTERSLLRRRSGMEAWDDDVSLALDRASALNLGEWQRRLGQLRRRGSFG